MKSEVFNAHNKYRILKHAMKEKNVSHTCEIFGISRATFYNWNRAYMKHGMSGLELKDPKKPIMPNKVDLETENRILNYVIQFPRDGPKRIYYELKSEGLSIGETGIYNVLKRKALTTSAKREVYAKQTQVLKFEPMPTHMLNPSISKKIKSKRNILEKSTYPGHCVIQRIDFMGTFDGIGKIYQYSVIDTFSHWGIVKLYNRKRDIDIWDYFEVKLVYLMRIFNLNIDQLFTIKSKPFIPCFVNGDKYQEILETFKIDHIFISQATSSDHEGSKVLDAFNVRLVKGFYEKIGNEIHYDNFVQVERAMNKFVRLSNFSNPITSGINAGKTSAEVVLKYAAENNVDLDTLPLWLMAVINAPKRETCEQSTHESEIREREMQDEEK